jgi:hypothetical protein
VQCDEFAYSMSPRSRSKIEAVGLEVIAAVVYRDEAPSSP